MTQEAYVTVDMTDTNEPGPSTDHPVNWKVIADEVPDTSGAVALGIVDNHSDCYCPETKNPKATMYQHF